MRKQSRIIEYNEMWEEIQNSQSYLDALKIISKHVELVDLDGDYKV